MIGCPIAISAAINGEKAKVILVAKIVCRDTFHFNVESATGISTHKIN
jgi:hypothetical protein